MHGLWAATSYTARLSSSHRPRVRPLNLHILKLNFTKSRISILALEVGFLEILFAFKIRLVVLNKIRMSYRRFLGTVYAYE